MDLETAYKRMRQDIHKFAHRAIGDEAEDIVQETFFCAYRARETFDENKDIRPWIWAIARNKIIDLLRRRQKGNEIRRQIEFTDLTPPETGKINLESLAGNQRKAIEMRTLGFSIREISAEMRVSDQAVRCAIYRAKRKLMKMEKRRSARDEHGKEGKV